MQGVDVPPAQAREPALVSILRAYKGSYVIGNAQKMGGGFVGSADDSVNRCPGKRVYWLLLEPRTMQLCLDFHLENH